MQVIGTAGHVDHGKSTLVQRLTGIDPDRWDEEKRRGLTIDLGFAWLPLPSGREIGLVDVPGHERFIKNMLAGAGGVTVCLFVVAANEGWMPQSAEHLAIIDVLGISSGVVALTKVDMVDRETVDLAVEETREHLANTSLSNAPVIPVSAHTGAGVDTLIETLDEVVSAAPVPADIGRPRLWVDRVFSIAGAGTVVTGTLAGGTFRIGDRVDIAPEGRRARVRGIQSHKRSLDAVGPGNRVAMNLAGLEREGAQRGDAIVATGSWRPTRLVDATIRVLPSEILGVEHKLTAKGAHLLYVGSAETPVRVQLLDTGSVGPGQSAFAQLRLRDALPLERGDRFVLRDAGRVLTFGGGIVLDPLARPVGRSKEARSELLRALEGAAGVDVLEALLEAEGELSLADALFRSGLSEVGDAGPLLGDRVVSAPRLAELRRDLTQTLADYHHTHPLERGMQKETARAALDLSAPAFQALLEITDEVTDGGAVVGLRSFSVTLNTEQEEQRVALVDRIGEGRFSPPLASELGADASFLRSLVNSGDLVKIDGFYLTAANALEARRMVREAITTRGPLSVAEIRDLLQTTRKYAVPLCEWLDATGTTVRKGDTRILGPNE